MKKLISFVLAALLAALCFAGCEEAGTGSQSGVETITIGMVGCYTGDYAVYGNGVKTGAELYFDEINAAGGINGKQVKVVAYDNKGDMAETVTAFNRIVDDGAVAVLGAVLTGNTMAQAVRERITHPIRIPSFPANAETSESLNVAIATAIVLAEFRRPR